MGLLARKHAVLVAIAAVTACITPEPMSAPEVLQPPLDADFTRQLHWAMACPAAFYVAINGDRTVRLQVELNEPGTATLDGTDALPQVHAYAGECLIIRDCDHDPVPTDEDCEQRLDHRYEGVAGEVSLSQFTEGPALVRLNEVVFQGLDGDPSFTVTADVLPGGYPEPP